MTDLPSPSADDGGPAAPTPPASTSAIPPAWHPDPQGHHQLRWWDGEAWTDNVSSNGVASLDPVDMSGTVPVGQQPADKIRHQVEQQAGLSVGEGPASSDLLHQRILVVNQKWKLIEVNNEYAVYDQHGTQVGGVRQVGQSTLKKAVRLFSNIDQFLTHTLQVVDVSGQVLMVMTRPAKFMKSRLNITDGAGRPIGEIVQQNVIGKIRFSLEAGGQTLGSINAENWRAWNFAIRDAAGDEIARVTKTWEGLAKAMFTTADNYVLQIHRPLPDPLRQLVVASALCIDTALKQDDG